MDKINLQEEVIRDDQGRPCPHARWTHSVLPSTLVYIEEVEPNGVEIYMGNRRNPKHI